MMTKILGVLGVLLSIAIILAVVAGCAPREDKYWEQITKEIK